MFIQTDFLTMGAKRLVDPMFGLGCPLLDLDFLCGEAAWRNIREHGRVARRVSPRNEAAALTLNERAKRKRDEAPTFGAK